MGTYECLLAASEQPCLSAAALAASLNSYCHVVPDKFVTLAYFPSGIMIKWFHDLLYGEAHGEAQGDDTLTRNGDLSSAESAHYARLEREAAAGPTGLCITPNLIGTCNPHFNPHERATISGLSANTTRGQIYRGILEGIACEMSQMTEILQNAMGEFRDIYVTGGGSRSALGLQLRAALSGRQLHVWEGPCSPESHPENTPACPRPWNLWSATSLRYDPTLRLRQPTHNKPGNTVSCVPRSRRSQALKTHKANGRNSDTGHSRIHSFWSYQRCSKRS